ncbi:hypothetical protein PL11_001840 [Lentilactobacillus curieae]|uniref:Uncharacterized protein n=1 Tax=Lentilactobacillus curieae TaxID=1138822 RepID=A0A1S6QGL8_9LACO|nr:hypothetical protein [Lentilactobacillus curieae]AQW20745.1 hypothetical protein PL11_001840 [Lentilactobacillus curieae]
MKKSALVLVALTTLGLSTVTTSVESLSQQTAQAATWHKGTPKSWRGSWINKPNGRWTSFKALKAGFELGSQGMPVRIVKYAKYRKVNKSTYAVFGYAVPNGMFLGRNTKVYLKTYHGKHYIKSYGYSSTYLRVSATSRF